MRQRKQRRLAAALALGALSAVSALSTTAHADERTEARSHFKRGMAIVASTAAAGTLASRTFLHGLALPGSLAHGVKTGPAGALGVGDAGDF